MLLASTSPLLRANVSPSAYIEVSMRGKYSNLIYAIAIAWFAVLAIASIVTLLIVR